MGTTLSRSGLCGALQLSGFRGKEGKRYTLSPHVASTPTSEAIARAAASVTEPTAEARQLASLPELEALLELEPACSHA